LILQKDKLNRKINRITKENKYNEVEEIIYDMFKDKENGEKFAKLYYTLGIIEEKKQYFKSKRIF